MMMRIHDDYVDELEELRAQARYERRYQMDLMRHHDCRDPDHPGCEHCEETEDDDTE